METKHKFLHGTLEATIFHATPYTPAFPCVFVVWNGVLQCTFLNGKACYVTIKIDNKKVAKTSHESDRVWNQTFQILCAHQLDSTVTITLKTKCSILGRIQIQAHRIVHEASYIDGFFPLVMENGKPNPVLKLRFMLWFRPAESEPTWGNILWSGDFLGIKNATFPQRSDCSVVLYQDAHHCSSFQPPYSLCKAPRKLWEDVYKAIDDAKYLIYIAGWSFNPKMVLVRDPQTDIPYGYGVRLGELLKRKAEEGVAVRIMVWDDETSLPLIKNRGVMSTHDEEAFAYFKHTKVVCKLCPRLHFKFPTLFAHHQKTITVDTRSSISPSHREILSFVGGLDLCDGRYDTEEHSLFRTLNTESHSQDFYQISLSGACVQKGGPREPWHDVHACIIGEAAMDVLSNFEQRWNKQCNPSLLVPISTIPELSSIPSERDWKVQVYRSIDHISATHLPRNFAVEQSIHEAYVEAIRRADRFIYIENQYFIGGCHLWEKDRRSGCRNLIPIEIALKVASKIRARERFAVYILIPMWPEGAPESEPVDDLYILIGSANVNQRSMDGQRDSEIAVGGLVEEVFQEPQSLECVERIRSIGEKMWGIYSAEEVVDMEGVHLVTYPVTVTKDGSVEEVADGDGNFPDTKTLVRGRRSRVLPPIFTT